MDSTFKYPFLSLVTMLFKQNQNIDVTRGNKEENALKFKNTALLLNMHLKNKVLLGILYFIVIAKKYLFYPIAALNCTVNLKNKSHSHLK